MIKEYLCKLDDVKMTSSNFEILTQTDFLLQVKLTDLLRYSTALNVFYLSLLYSATGFNNKKYIDYKMNGLFKMSLI